MGSYTRYMDNVTDLEVNKINSWKIQSSHYMDLWSWIKLSSFINSHLIFFSLKGNSPKSRDRHVVIEGLTSSSNFVKGDSSLPSISLSHPSPSFWGHSEDNVVEVKVTKDAIVLLDQSYFSCD